jgi:hypothetical protein
VNFKVSCQSQYLWLFFHAGSENVTVALARPTAAAAGQAIDAMQRNVERCKHTLARISSHASNKACTGLSECESFRFIKCSFRPLFFFTVCMGLTQAHPTASCSSCKGLQQRCIRY